ncbi:MAG: hypothetical protein DRG83_03720 [Deltaproteobacteria bacterium]|nr:MAG: hypothetical protein DRG83_03720 [Deltaproteobacteria bacterium]
MRTSTEMHLHHVGKRRGRMSEWVAIALIFSLVSVFWKSGRIVLSTGNLLPVSLLLAGGIFVALFPAFLSLERDFSLRLPRALVWALLTFMSYFLADMLQGTVLEKELHYLKLLALLFWAFVLYNLLQQANLEKVIRAFVLLGVIVTVVGLAKYFLLQAHFYLNLFEEDIRGRNASAHALMIWTVTLLPYVFRKTSLFSIWTDRFFLFIFFTSLLLTLSRGALIAAVIPAIWLALSSLHLKNNRCLLSILLITLLIGTAVWVSARILPEIVERFAPQTIFTLASMTTEGEFVSNATRLSLAKIGVRMVIEQPWGFGLASFPKYFLHYLRPGDYLPPNRDIIFSPHVQYLDVAVQGGILALFLFVLFLGVFVRFSVSVFRNLHSASTLEIAITLLWVAHLVYFLFSWPLERMMFWTIVAMSLAVVRQYNRKDWAYL